MMYGKAGHMGSMMEDSEMPSAEMQAGALEEMPFRHEPVYSMQKGLAAAGASAAQPKSGKTFSVAQPEVEVFVEE